MLTTGALLILLSALTVHSIDLNVPLGYYYIDYDVDEPTEAPRFTFDTRDWVVDLLDWSKVCDPNPCLNGGSCQKESFVAFTCLCPEPYIGKMCQRVRNVCEGIRCGHGDCVVNLRKPPYYECKCRPPYQGPDCMTRPASPCEPNPCQNGGLCAHGNRRFYCACPDGYTGKFCETAPNDCFMGNGETYRGSVSVTEDGDECLDWHSSFIVLEHGEDPFTIYSHFPGLEYNNHCRNPDGDQKPWCFIKKLGKLDWAFCKVKKCLEVSTPSPPPTTPEAVPAQFSQCGKPQLPSMTRIFGGTKSCPAAHPWQVSLRDSRPNSPFPFGHFCGGILLNSCWVLTAAHCIPHNFDFHVVLGVVNMAKQEESAQTIPVIQKIAHENYRIVNKTPYDDIALLKLQVTEGPYCAKETRYVKSACLPDQMFPAGKECVVSGWGKTETSDASSKLLNARVSLISQARCSAPEIYGPLLDNGMFCAGDLRGGIDSCQGDSGGPLVCEHDGTHYVSGVVSWGTGCGLQNKPGVYANVLTYLNWINSKMNSN